MKDLMRIYEKYLFNKYNNGTKEEKEVAKKGIVELYTGSIELYGDFIKKYILHNINYGLNDFDDVYMEGVIGFINAIDKFDVNKGFKFSTFSSFYIYRNIIKYLKSNTEIRLPLYMNEEYKEYLDNVEKLQTRLNKQYINERDLKRFCGYNKNRIKLYEQITDQKNTSPLFQLLENEEELFEDPLLKIKSKEYDYIKEDNHNLENINKMINDYYSNKDLFKDTSDLYKLRSELMFRLYFGIYDDESKIKLTKHINREVSDEENFGFTEIGKIFGTTYNRALSSINSDIKNIKKLGLYKKYMGDTNE